MTSTPKSTTEDVLGESWVELHSSSHTPDRVTPLPFNTGEEYLRLLREAQRESNQSSARVSLASSRRDTPRGSPKSPPNSPNTELSTEDDLKGVYINYCYKQEGDFMNVERNTDWIWDWSSRPDQAPPKDWKFKHPKRKTYSIRHAKVGKNSLFSKEVLYTLFLTNFISLLLGTGVGQLPDERLGDTFPSVTVVIGIYLSMIVTSCSGRDHSVIGSDKKYLRVSMTHKRSLAKPTRDLPAQTQL